MVGVDKVLYYTYAAFVTVIDTANVAVMVMRTCTVDIAIMVTLIDTVAVTPTTIFTAMLENC